MSTSLSRQRYSIPEKKNTKNNNNNIIKTKLNEKSIIFTIPLMDHAIDDGVIIKLKKNWNGSARITTYIGHPPACARY